MKKGYSNKLLEADLSTHKTRITNLDERISKDFIGGAGLGVCLIAENVPPLAHPYSEENILTIFPGPMTGSSIPASGRLNFNAKSPLNGGIGDASMGGMTGPRLKCADLDGVMITGRSDYRSVLIIDSVNDIYYFEPMPVELRCKDVFGIGGFLLDYYGRNDAAVIAAGPAGRKGVPYACLTGMHWDNKHGLIKRQAGRTGMGAVMASKGLDAILIRSEKIPHNPADPDEFRKNSSGLYKFIGKCVREKHFLKEHGTPELVEYCNVIQTLPAKNFGKGVFSGYKGICAEAIKEKIGAEPYSCCDGCNISCGKISMIDGEPVDLEYESIGLLGSNLLISDIEGVARASLLCDKAGLDTISTGNAIGFAIECREKGLLNEYSALELGIPPRDLDLLKWGDDENLQTLIKKIINRRGIGAFLSRGVKYMSSQLPGSGEFAMHSKGLECSAYVTTEAPLMTLSFCAAEQRGADHKSAWVITAEREGKMTFEILLFFIKMRRWFDTAVMDRLPWIDFPHPESRDRKNMVIAELYKNAFNAMTGAEYDTVDDMLVPAERMYNLTRVFNVMSGFTKEYDIPPKRMLGHAYPGKTDAEAMKSYNKLLNKFYKSWGWSRNGVPKPRTIRKLGLEELVHGMEV